MSWNWSKMNKNNIQRNLPLQFSYKELKPLLARGYYPVIRKYIRKRISPQGILVPDSHLLTVCRFTDGLFTEGVPSAKIYKKAVKDSKK